MNAFINIHFKTDTTSRPTTIISKINKVPNVKFAHLVTGPVAAMAWVEASTPDDFWETLLEINNVSGVSHTTTNVAW